MNEWSEGNYLPDVVIRHIFKYLRLSDIQNASLTCKSWANNGTAAVRRLQHHFARHKRFFWHRIALPSDARHPTEDRIDSALCFSPSANSVYLFGGANLKREAAFNDLFRFDLDRLCWSRVMARGSVPRPKGQATMSRWGPNCLLLYGGIGPESSTHVPAAFYSEVHLFFPDQSSWIQMGTANDGPHLSGHAATIVQDYLIVFGGRLAERVPNHDVHVLDLKRSIWKMPQIRGIGPNGRYGATFVPISAGNLLLVNGAPFLRNQRQEPSELSASDWILSFDPENIDAPWSWTKKTVIGLKNDEAEDRFMRNSCSAVASWNCNGRIRLASLGVSPTPQTSRDTIFLKEYKNIEEEMRRVFHEVKTILERRFRERIDKLKKIRHGLQEIDDELLDANLEISTDGIHFKFTNLWNKALEKEMLETKRSQGTPTLYEDRSIRKKAEARSNQISVTVSRHSKDSFPLLVETDLTDVTRAIRQYINTLQTHYYSKGPEPQASSRSVLRRAGLPRLSLFLADVTDILKQDIIEWDSQPIEMRASPFCNRFAFLAVKGELFLHGGVTENEPCVGNTYLLSPEREP